MSKDNYVKITMQEHSLAKVELYSKYLEKYLAVLCNVPHINTINIFDLFCGEGVFTDGNEGSPLAGIKTADSVINGQSKNKPYIHFFFNDKDKSEIETDKLKIERVEESCLKLRTHPNISTEYNNESFETILPKAIALSQKTSKTKSLFFIDPYGYKEVKPYILHPILRNEDAELVLFLPITPMYRFAQAAFETKFHGSDHLKQFLLDLFGKQPPAVKSTEEFIASIKKQFEQFLLPDKFYIDTFSLQRNKSNTYCLFFFTRKILGFEKMLEAKWQLDEAYGKGFTLGKQMNMFSSISFSPYPKILKAFLHKNGPASNEELYKFGLINSYLPKHTTEALNFLKDKEKIPIKVDALDGKPAKGYYLNYINSIKSGGRKVQIGIDFK